MTHLLIYLGLTLLLEIILFYIIFKKSLTIGMLKIIIAANLLTNPALNYILELNNIYFRIGFINFFILEAIVIGIEALIYNKYLKFSFAKSVSISFILNIFSYIVGSMVLIAFSYISKSYF
jgi:hypothetical protein